MTMINIFLSIMSYISPLEVVKMVLSSTDE